MGEGTRKVHVGAQATAPTAPHATPPVEPGDARTGPARFWKTHRLRVVVAVLLSLIGHFTVGPFSFFPSGPSIEIKDQEGELTIPIDLLQAGLEDEPPQTPEPPPTGAGTTAVPPVKGPNSADAGRDREAPDAEVDAAVAASTLDAGGSERDGGEPVDGSSDGAPTLDEAGIALGGVDGGAAGPATGRDARGILGGAASVSAGADLVTVFVNMQVIRSHPEGARLQPILAAIPQWKQFMVGSSIDPLRDCDWLLIMGPSLLNTEKDAVFVHYSAPDTVIDTAIGTISKAYPKGGPMDVGVPKVKAWRAYADNAERVFLRPSPHVAVIVPATHATQFARVLVANPIVPRIRPGEAVSIRALRPGGSINLIPQSISELRIWVVPRNADGGADVYAEGDCPDPAAASAAAVDIRDTIQKKNSFGVRLVTAGLFNSVDVTTDGPMLKAHLSASKEQIDAVLGLVAGQVGATLPPPTPSPAPSATP